MEGYLDVTLHNLLSPIVLNEDTADEQEIEVVVAVAEESFTNTSMVPGISLYQIDDVSLGYRNYRSDLQRYVDENDLSQGFERLERPQYRRLSYQFDLYTYKRKNLVQLTKAFYKLLKRDYGCLIDERGLEVSFRQTDFMDFKIAGKNEERIFKRCLTYAFDAWVFDNEDVKGTVGVVQSIQIDVKDNDSEETLDTVTVE